MVILILLEGRNVTVVDFQGRVVLLMVHLVVGEVVEVVTEEEGEVAVALEVVGGAGEVVDSGEVDEEEVLIDSGMLKVISIANLR